MHHRNERDTARCRIILSIAVLVAIAIDPAQSSSPRALIAVGGIHMSPGALAVMAAHLGYSFAILWALAQARIAPARLAAITPWTDVVFGAGIAFLTQRSGGAFYAFLSFAVLVVGLRAGLRRALLVTAGSVGLYTSLTIASSPGDVSTSLMRAVYIAIVGCFVAALGQSRLNFEGEITLEATKERHRIARDLHDGCMQTLAALNLRLSEYQRLLRRGEGAEVLDDLAQVQGCVTRQYDEIRAYARRLTNRSGGPVLDRRRAETRFSVQAEFAGSAALVQHVLHILQEGVTNVQRHASAPSASVRVSATGSSVLITIDDDGVGFGDGLQPPWTIATRVEELGGRIRVERESQPGGHLAILLPAA